MKQIIKIPFLIFVVLIFFLSSGFDNGEVKACDVKNEQPSQGKISKARIHHDFYVRTENPGSALGDNRNLSRTNLKNQLNQFNICFYNPINELFQGSEPGYMDPGQPPLALSKSELIYPFHFFW